VCIFNAVKRSLQIIVQGGNFHRDFIYKVCPL
jgi:hypothetical protein